MTSDIMKRNMAATSKMYSLPFLMLLVTAVTGLNLMSSRVAPRIFVCDENGGAIFEGDPEDMEFTQLPLEMVQRPVAVAYSGDDDLVFWIDAGDRTLNRAFKNGSDHTVLDSGEDYRDMAIFSPLKWIALASNNEISLMWFTTGETIFRRALRSGILAITFQPNGYLYITTATPSTLVWIDPTFNVLGNVSISSVGHPQSIVFDRQGTNLFIVDGSNNTIVSFNAMGENYKVVVDSDGIQPGNLTWYRDSPVWTDRPHYGFGFINEKRGLSPGFITSDRKFLKPMGIHIFPGKAYNQGTDQECLGNDLSCDNSTCIPFSWICDGVRDCSSNEDEEQCAKNTDESLVLVADSEASAIYLASANNFTFTQLPFFDLESPARVDFDPEGGTVFWTDSFIGSIMAADINGGNQREVVLTMGVPHDIVVDLESHSILWTDAFMRRIQAIHFNSSNRRTIVTNIESPRSLTIVPCSRMLYWTDWGFRPQIGRSDLLGRNRIKILDINLFQPDGLTADAAGMWIYWFDSSLGRIETTDSCGNGRRILADVTHQIIFPFDIVWHRGTVMWTDKIGKGISVIRAPGGRWPRSYRALNKFVKPNGFFVFNDYSDLCRSDDTLHVISGACDCPMQPYLDNCTDPCALHPCINDGICTMAYTERKYTCDCRGGWTGGNCEQDINECEVNRPCDHLCNNTDGSFVCLCEQGYRLNADRRTCDDVNECAETRPCDHLCSNTDGSFVCLCEQGYRLNADRRTYDVIPDSCTSNPCVNGICNQVDDGTYVCECDASFEGTHCTVTKKPAKPIKVLINPTSHEVNSNHRVELTCQFQHALHFEWEKNKETIPMTQNQESFSIDSITPRNIGYYRCVGIGGDGSTAATDAAAIYIRGLLNIVASNVKFQIPLQSPQDLSNPASETYMNASAAINDYVENGIRIVNPVWGNNTDVAVVSSNLREGSVKADLTIYLEERGMSALMLQDAITTSLQSLANASNGMMDVSDLTTRSTSICYASTWNSRFGEVSFKIGVLGQWANSTGECPFNTTQAHQPKARAYCQGDKIAQAKWHPRNNCGSLRNVTELLEQIESVDITEDTVLTVSNNVAVITRNTDSITSKDVSLVSTIAANIANKNITDRVVAEDITNVVSNIASVDNAALQAAEEESNSISKFIDAFERQLNNVEIEDGKSINIAEENVVVQIKSVTREDLQQGLILTLTGESATDLRQSQIMANSSKRAEDITDKKSLIAKVNLPPEISQIAVPKSYQGNETSEHVRLIMNVFATASLFISRSLRNFSEGNEMVNRTANTPVISLSIGNKKVEDLAQPINLTFPSLQVGYINQTCVFWDEMTIDWSTKGCTLVVSEVMATQDSWDNNGDETEKFTCACDHLTNFAILMDIHSDPQPEFAFSLLSFIGCAVSIFCLIISLATYLWNRNLRNRQHHQIFICLSVTMLGLYIAFVVMLSVDTRRGVSEVIPGVCGFLAALVHFFVLSSIAWMGIEGFNTYLIIVRVFDSYIPNFMIKAGLAAWGIPMVIVILTGAIANTNYATDDVCFLQLRSQVGGLLVPMAIILITNMIIFILVIRQLVISQKVGGKVKDKEDRRREAVERIQNAVTISVLLGLTWISGYLLLIKYIRSVAQGLFIVFNSFQGLFMFILYCVRKPIVRKQWGLTCSFRRSDGTSSFSSRSERRTSSSSAPTTSLASKFIPMLTKNKYDVSSVMAHELDCLSPEKFKSAVE